MSTDKINLSWSPVGEIQFDTAAQRNSVQTITDNNSSR